MNRFIGLPPPEQKVYLHEAAAKRGLSSVIIEKDFWVCLALEKIFQSSFRKDVTFKGGTSLSKVYGLIGRFSEDIDLTLDKDFVNSFSDATSYAPKKITKQCKKVIAEHLLPELVNTLSEYGTCNLAEDDEQTILFHYPSVIDESHNYIQKQVRIEFGARGEREPSAEKTITPYLAEILPITFDNAPPIITVSALAAERTFWEKATILHSIAHQPEDRALNERMSRHFHDLFVLAENQDILEAALSDIDLLQQVTQHKQKYFKETWDWYASAKIGTLSLLPPRRLLSELKKDYEKTKVMLFDKEPISYEALVEGLKKLEATINSHS
tara:strand:- start:1297 stop:2274 length:978 start_codon:yes stop_codon:yes gene_type:complete